MSPGDSAVITCKAKYGNATDSIKVYCVKPLDQSVKSEFVNPITIIYKQPSAGAIVSVHYSVNFFIRAFLEAIKNILPIYNILFSSSSSLNASANSTILTGGECTVMGRWGSFAYIEVGNKDIKVDGFVRYGRLDKEIDGFLNLSATDINVWGNGITYSNKKLSTTYKGKVEWIVEDNEVISFNDSTGQITGLKPGTTTITAKSDGMSAVCTVHSLYKWPQSWETKSNADTDFYIAKGNGYQKNKTLVSNISYTVLGDDGTDNGMAYVKTVLGGTESRGFVPIDKISTKGTISQYNKMNFRWPINDINIKKISSPFGPRSSNNGGNHKGFDIVSDVSGEIEGKPVVASYNGTITKIYVDNNKETSHGNAIVVATDKTDPISGKKLTVIYMHLYRWDTNSSGNIVVNGKVLKEGDPVTKEQIIGSAGNTGKNTSGAHLHYEVNNQNAAIRSGSNNPFTETINPIYFYMSMDESITKSDSCEAASNGNGFYWYGENK